MPKMCKVDIVSCLLAMGCEEHVKTIFLSLDGGSLSASYQVCKTWHIFLQQRVWHSPHLKSVLDKKLRNQWRLGRPNVLTNQIKYHNQGVDVVCDDEVTLLSMDDGRLKVLRNARPSGRGKKRAKSEEENFTLFELDCRDQHNSVNFRLPVKDQERPGSVKFCLGPDVILTVGNGLVKCWNRTTGDLEYKSPHHTEGNRANVMAVTILDSGLVATGADGGEVVVLQREDHWREWLEMGKEESSIWNIKSRLVTEDRADVITMHTDSKCGHTAVGTETAITLWDLGEGHVVQGSQRIQHDPDMLVYIQPHVFVLYNGVKMWNMMTGEPIKHIEYDIRGGQIGTNGTEVFFSSCVCCEDCLTKREFGLNRIRVFESSELVNPDVPNKDVRWREMLYLSHIGNLSVAINRTSIVAIFPRSEKPSKTTMIRWFDFSRGPIVNGEDNRTSLAQEETVKSRNKTLTGALRQIPRLKSFWKWVGDSD